MCPRSLQSAVKDEKCSNVRTCTTCEIPSFSTRAHDFAGNAKSCKRTSTICGGPGSQLTYSEMTQATSVDVFFSLPGGLATEWHGDSLCQQRLAGSVIGWLGLWIPGFSNLIVVAVHGLHGPGFDLYSLNNLTLLFSNTDHFESFWHILISYFHFSLVFVVVVNVVSPSRQTFCPILSQALTLHFILEKTLKIFEVVSPCITSSGSKHGFVFVNLVDCLQPFHIVVTRRNKFFSSYSFHFKASDRGYFHHLSSVVEKCKSMSTKSFFCKNATIFACGRQIAICWRWPYAGMAKHWNYSSPFKVTRTGIQNHPKPMPCRCYWESKSKI